MRLIVDGMNAIGSRPDGWWRDRDGAKRRLAAGLAAYARAAGVRVTVVFDGRPPAGLPEGERGGVRVLHAPGRGRNAADDRIAALVAADADPASLLVATSDAGLRRRVRASGAGTVGGSRLLRAVDAALAGRKPPPLRADAAGTAYNARRTPALPRAAERRKAVPITPTNTLRYETEGRKAIITLTRPEAMNALNREILNAIGEAVREYEADDNLLVAIVTGEGGRAFSAGADLKEMTQRDQSEGASASDNDGLNGFQQLDDCRKPLIAAVDGYCLAGGLELTIYCDMVVATEQSRFGLPEPRRSLLAGPGLHNLSRIIPYREAMLIQLTGGHMSSQRAYDIGLIQRLVPDRDAMWAAAHELADEILECAPLAVQAIKRIVKVGRPLPVEYSEKLAEPISAFISTTEDRLEGPKAFAEKRAPNWKMR